MGGNVNNRANNITSFGAKPSGKLILRISKELPIMQDHLRDLVPMGISRLIIILIIIGNRILPTLPTANSIVIITIIR